MVNKEFIVRVLRFPETDFSCFTKKNYRGSSQLMKYLKSNLFIAKSIWDVHLEPYNTRKEISVYLITKKFINNFY